MKKFIFAGILILACFFLYLFAGFMGPANDVITVIIEYAVVAAWIAISIIITWKIEKKIDRYIKTL